MKKILVLLLPVITGMGKLCPAQIGSSYSINDYDGTSMPATTRPGNHFHFNLTNGNRFSLHIPQLKNVDSLPATSILLQKIYRDLVQVNSFSANEMAVKKITCLVREDGALQYKLAELPVTAQSFLVKENDTAELKIQQDTLRIVFEGRAPTLQMIGGDGLPIETGNARYTFTFILNDWKQLQLYTNGMVDEKIQVMRAKLKEQMAKKKVYGKYNFTFNGLEIGQKGYMIFPGAGSMRNSRGWDATVSAGLQNYKQSIVPSLQLGPVYRRTSYYSQSQYTDRFALLWEPVFFFAKNSSDELVTSRNDFITFRYDVFRNIKIGQNAMSFTSGFSVGYLVNQSGGFMKENSIKISVNGLRYKTLLLEPQIYFNRLFKDVSPSLRLSVSLE